MSSSQENRSREPNLARLLTYAASLELEVDRLRRHGRLLQQELRLGLDKLQKAWSARPGAEGPATGLADAGAVIQELRDLLRDLQDLSGYHPAHDQVIAIAIRPLVEQVFRWQQRLQGAESVRLQLELASDHVEWFPARLRHILDNLISNALKYRDPDKAEAWVRLELHVTPEVYQLRVSDNGLGMDVSKRDRAFDLLYRAIPAREAGLSVGLPVVQLLVEQSGGSLTMDSGLGQGTTFVVELPRYPMEDFLS